MSDFPRTTVGGVSLPRLIAGTNWFLGYSHTSEAKDRFIKRTMDRSTIAEVLRTFICRGVDAVMGPPLPLLAEAIDEAEQRAGRKAIRIFTPWFNLLPGGDPALEPQRVFDDCKSKGCTFCLSHQGMTDALIDRLHKVIRGIDKYTAMIREREMVPGLSSHMPEAITYADATGADVETYIQIYNAAGFLMQMEVDWVMRVVRDAHKPVMTIKPLASGRLLPVVGLGYVWNTLRDQDMVTVGTATADEASELIDLSLDFLARRVPVRQLQQTRSKASL